MQTSPARAALRRPHAGLNRRSLLAGCLAALLITPAIGQIIEPSPGSALRSTIVDAFRPGIEAELGAPVIFKISVIRASGNWAFIEGTPMRPGGVPLDWRRTKFREAFANDAMSDIVMGLLRRAGSGWTVVETAIGPTDVAWEEWRQQYRLPRALFGAP